MKITIAGTGYVGLSNAVLLARHCAPDVIASAARQSMNPDTLTPGHPGLPRR